MKSILLIPIFLVLLVVPTAFAQNVATEEPDCNMYYPDFCIPNVEDMNCSDLEVGHFTALIPDPYKLDANNDGLACTGNPHWDEQPEPNPIKGIWAAINSLQQKATETGWYKNYMNLKYQNVFDYTAQVQKRVIELEATLEKAEYRITELENQIKLHHSVP